MTVRYNYASLEDFLVSTPATIDGQLDDGWGATFPVKGREIQATVLFADIPFFTSRTAELTSTETLAFVNNFVAWITAEALRGRPCIIDKYIGDEIMVVFSTEFGATDPFGEALDAARWMGEHDVLDFQPQIGLASGQVTVGYVGTPLRYSCSVFGRPVALAARCAKVPRAAGAERWTTRIAFPAVEWEGRDFATQFYPRKYRKPDGTEQEGPMLWSMGLPRSVDLKNYGSVSVIEIGNPMMRLNHFTAEDRAREGVEALRTVGRYWPAERK
jgi:hypothetical protein